MKQVREETGYRFWHCVSGLLLGAMLFLAFNSKPWGQVPFPWGLVGAVAAVVWSAVCCLLAKRRLKCTRWAVCALGSMVLIAFLTSSTVSIVYAIVNAARMFSENWALWLVGCAVCVLWEALLFWIGIICVYCTSTQLGISLRVIGALVGMIPVANLVALIVILREVNRELATEVKRVRRNESRKADAVCATRYPVLLVHGVFFRDGKYLNYWGRIPAELEANGARIYYGNHQSALSVADSGKELAERIRAIVTETGCGKVHIIAHSKGGLDCRWALAHEGVAEMVASLTTINTPHRGCLFADYLLGKAPEGLRKKVAAAYHGALVRMGDTDPDFLAAVEDLTASRCRALDAEMPMPEGVICHSVGSILKRAQGGCFPLNFSYHLVKYFDGANDGLVGEESFAWGSRYTLLKNASTQGISHGDVIDLNRKNLPDFDVREFYVSLLFEFREQGL